MPPHGNSNSWDSRSRPDKRRACTTTALHHRHSAQRFSEADRSSVSCTSARVQRRATIEVDVTTTMNRIGTSSAELREQI